MIATIIISSALLVAGALFWQIRSVKKPKEESQTLDIQPVDTTCPCACVDCPGCGENCTCACCETTSAPTEEPVVTEPEPEPKVELEPKAPAKKRKRYPKKKKK